MLRRPSETFSGYQCEFMETFDDGTYEVTYRISFADCGDYPDVKRIGLVEVDVYGETDVEEEYEGNSIPADLRQRFVREFWDGMDREEFREEVYEACGREVRDRSEAYHDWR